MQIAPTRNVPAPKMRTAPSTARQHNDAPVEISVNDVVYIRQDHSEPSSASSGLNRGIKIGGMALVGGTLGAIPGVGALSNILCAGQAKQEQGTGTIAIGGAALNVAASVGWAATGNPVWMAIPAAAGAAAWGLEMNDRLST